MGCVTVRIIRDGTTGIDLNRFIKVVDACNFPLAPDIKAVMRIQSSRGITYFGLVVDISGPHRLVAVREEDWPLQACQLEEGGDVYINKVGTFGVSSAADWWGRLAAAVQRAGLAVVSALWPFMGVVAHRRLGLVGQGEHPPQSVVGVPLVAGGASGTNQLAQDQRRPDVQVGWI